MTEQIMSSGVCVVQVWAELLPGGQVEVRAGLSDGSFLLLDRTDGDLARMMKSLVDGFLDDGEDREMLSSSLLTGLLRVRAADQISDDRVKTVELNKLLQSIICLPHKFSQSEAVLDFFKPTGKDRIFRPAQDPSSNHEKSPIIKYESKDKDHTRSHRHQGNHQTVRDESQEKDQTNRDQGQEKDQTIRNQGQEKDQTLRHQGQEKDQTISNQGQEKDQTLRHQGQEKDQTISNQDQEKKQAIRHQDQENDQTVNHQGQENDQTVNHQGQEKDQAIINQGREKDQTVRHYAQVVEKTLGQGKGQTIRNDVREETQIFRQGDHEKKKTIKNQVQGVHQNIRHQAQQEDQTVGHVVPKADQTITHHQEEDQVIRHQIQEVAQPNIYTNQEIDQPIGHQDQELDHPTGHQDQEEDLVIGQEDRDVLRRASVLSEVWRSNGFCLANTETILFDLTPPTQPISQSEESADGRASVGPDVCLQLCHPSVSPHLLRGFSGMMGKLKRQSFKRVPPPGSIPSTCCTAGPRRRTSWSD